MCFLFDHFIVAVRFAAGVHLRARETRLGVDMKRRERVGNGADAILGSFRIADVARKIFTSGFLGRSRIWTPGNLVACCSLLGFRGE